MNLTEKIKDKPYWVLLILAIISTIWKSYPHMMVPDLLPADEYNNWVLFESMIREGKSFDFLLSPQTQFYLMYATHIVTGIGSKTLFKWTNAIIGGFSVFAFYYFTRTILDEEKALIASILYSFNEVYFYRACYLGSTEMLGLTLMFIMLGLYMRKKYLWLILGSILSAYVHVFPFAFGTCVIGIDLLSKRKTRPYALVLGISLFLLLFGPFSPHKKQKYTIMTRYTNRFSISNIFIYSPYELITVGIPCYLGTCALGTLSLYHKEKYSKFELMILFQSLLLIAVAYLFYDSMIMSPRRILLYTVIPLITVASKVKYSKPNLVYGSIILLMLISPPLKGTQTFVYVNDAITKPEVDAIMWLEENGYFEKADWRKWFTDRTLQLALNSYIFFNRPERNPETASVHTKEELDQINESIAKLHEEYEKTIKLNNNSNNTETQDTLEQKWDYAIISDRMRERAFFLIRYPVTGERSLEIRVPMKDLWIDDPRYHIVYDVDGVTVYEKNSD